MTLLYLFLIVHALLGAFDVICNHEIIARLPRLAYWKEEVLHSAREAAFTLLFFSMAWFEWRGSYSWFIAAVLIAELLITIYDTIVEVDTRILPVTERIAHVFLLINFGIVVALAVPTLAAWYDLPSEIAFIDNGITSWLLTAFAFGAALWCIRDGLSAVRLKRRQQNGDKELLHPHPQPHPH